ncbi:MAG TPA: permease prefix domain 1-containing protein [Bacillota bacterium]|nr:permease prefix domain 1-containing protein [Bacillota bacterium]
MKDKIKKYVDGLFTDIYETQALRELKEEISANLLEKTNDLVAGGASETVAFQKAVADLGDMSELVGSLKKASNGKQNEDFRTFPLTKKQVLGYVVGSAIFLFGLMVGGIIYLRGRDPLLTLECWMPFILVAAPIFTYFGLNQETRHHYGMNPKRALSYCVAGEILLLGIFTGGILYFQGKELLVVGSTLAPFVIVSAIAFLFLGLTEKKRRKMGHGWEKEWIEYYSNPQNMMVYGSISGALWIFAIAAFVVLGFTWSWKYSWVVFVLAIGIDGILAAIFAAKRKKT